MNARKTVVVEPRGKQDFITVMKQFDDCVTAVDLATAQRGAALFAVCRGKASEGIDFSDASARLVVLVGIPYPPMNDARVSLKKEYLMRRVQAARAEAAAAAHVKLTSTVRLDTPVDQHLTADDWYQLEAVRAVNQSIGRAIRHSTDYGAVLLADVRYS
jgi:regulator of telomere elongation helicase 1